MRDEKDKKEENEIHYSYKFRIYPTKEQENLIQRTFGCCRYVFNHFLVEREKQYREENKKLSYEDCSNMLTKMKHKEETEWLCEVDSTALQAALQDLGSAYKNFSDHRAEKPKFKSKREHRKSYRSNDGKKVHIFSKAVQLPKLGKVKCRVSKEVKGCIKHATVSQNPSGKYFVSICCKCEKFAPLPKTGEATGIDVGIKTFAVTDQGEEYPNPKYLVKAEKKLARLQRQLSRKSKDSNRREKARIQVARLHEHIANQRRDMQQKLSTELIKQYDMIAIENLSSANMMKNHKLAKHMSHLR